MPLLWTCYDHPETGLPNTNNVLEGFFADLKAKVRIHSGISRNTGKSCWTKTSEGIIDIGTATGIYGLRRLKIIHYAELVGGAPNLTFAFPAPKIVHPTDIYHM